MRRVALIYNPASGQHPEQRTQLIAKVVAVLSDTGAEVKVFATKAPDSAGIEALEAVRQGYETILACGGDGTVHEAMQSLVGSSATLGVIPMGTANALATDLGLPASPLKAVKMLLSATAEQVPVGRVFYRDNEGIRRSRYFIVAAGIGADALFISRLDTRLKQRFGYALYFVEAFRVWAIHSFPLFAASFIEPGCITPRVEEVSQLLAVRISNFGGVLHNLVPDAALGDSELRVIAFKTRSRLRYLRFFAAVIFGKHRFSRTVELLKVVSVECRDLDGSVARSLVEADGELLGTLPARIEVVPEGLTLLVPSKSVGTKLSPLRPRVRSDG